MLCLNGIELTGMIISNGFTGSLPSAEAVKCFDGGTVLFTEERTSVDIDIESYADCGWLDYKTAELLSNMALQAGAVYVLETDDKTLRVRFRHEETEAVSLKPVREGVVKGDEAFFYGKLKLKTV